MTVKELRERAVQEAEAARAIKDKADEESRGLTQEEADKFDNHLKESERLEKEADRLDRLEQSEKRLTEPQKQQVKQEMATGERIEIIKPELFRFGQLKAFKGPKAEANAYRCGRFLAATLFNHAPSRQWCRDHGIDLRIDMDIDNRAMGESINTAGGFIVPDEFEQTIIDLREKYGNARRNCRIKTMASDHSNEPKKVGGLTAYPIGENTAFTESQQTWGNVELTAKKWGVLVRISSELTEDTLISLADDLANDVAMAFAMAEDVSCIDGDGTSTYHGIIGIRTKMIDGDHAGSYVAAASAGDNWSEIDASDLTNIMAALPLYARWNAKWHCSPVAKAAIFDRLLQGATGVTMRETADGPGVPRYMGYPIEMWPALPTDDSSAALNGKIMLIFGDMSMSSKMGIRRGIAVKRLEERYAEYDQIGIIASERYTINHHTIGEAAAVRGPVVGLQGTT